MADTECLLSVTLPPFTPEQLRGDVYFRRDFMELHARCGVAGVFEEDFSYGAAFVSVPGSDRRDLETPWGYGGPIGRTGGNVTAGLAAWNEHVRESGLAVAEFVRLHPFLNPAFLADRYDMLRYNRSIVLVDLKESRESRWRYYSDSTKSCIRRASHQLTVRRLEPHDAALLQESYEAGLGRNQAPPEYYFGSDFYEILLASPWATTWLASDGKGAEAIACFLHGDAGICHYHLAGGNDQARKVNAQYLLLDQAIEHFASRGVRYMCLGGGRTTDPDDALLRFKGKFSRHRAAFFVGGMIHDHEAFTKLGGGKSKFLCQGANAAIGSVVKTPEVACLQSLSSPLVRKESAGEFTREGRHVYLIGGGGHAAVLLATMRALGIECTGCISAAPFAHGASELPWLGGDEVLPALQASGVYLVNGIGSVSSMNLRRLIFERCKAMGFTFISLVHPSAVVEANVELSEGAQVMAGAILQTAVFVGRNSIINTGAIVDHDCKIGAHCHLASGVRISGGAKIGESTHVGTGASVIQEIAIGANAMVGAGAVVLSNVEAWGRVAGVPARSLLKVRRRFDGRNPQFASGESKP
jgi:UDP-perosamine 4-acetyltransferase